MKIVHKSKKAVTLHPQVSDLISKLLETPTDDLPDILGSIEGWKWPRSDLNAWIKVLNKFDGILEDVIRDYDVEKIQLNDFTPRTKEILCGILRFERLLLENSTNRKSFNSYDRINSLLFTSDVDVLVLALNLLLRPAQQYSAQQSVAQALNISTPRLQSLSRRWANFREHGVGLVDLANEHSTPQVESLPSELREVHFTFYRKDAPAENKGSDSSALFDATPKTPVRKASGPVPSASALPGAVHVYLTKEVLEKKTAMEVLADAIEQYSVPDDEKFELLCRIRTAMSLFKGKEEDRAKLITVRLLALAIFCHTHQESHANAALFLYEPDLVIHVAELLQLDRGVPISVQTSAIAALDAMARYRNKISEVLTAVNAGVNHGILLSLLRQTIADVANPDSTLPQSFLEALLSFVTFLASHGAGGNMVVAAGLVPLLIQTMENRLPNRLHVVSKTMQLVDNVLYGFVNAFQLFCAGRGVDVLVGRIEYEIDIDIQEGGDQERARDIALPYGNLSVARAAVLKNSLRSMHRMMQSSGTSEGLRGLIDSSLLKSIKKIMEHRVLFGPSVLSIAINIMATFVHNEPTCLTVIQEARVPEAFYCAVDTGLEPVIEVIQAIPNALGALCLNQVGQDQLASRPTVIPGLFAIFTSERHLQVLQDKENAVLIGTAVDELIRHHPMLKTAVFEALKSTLSKIEDLGNAFVEPEELKSWYRLAVAVKDSTPSSGRDEDITMGDVTVGPTTLQAQDDDAGQPNSNSKDNVSVPHDNYIVSFIDIVGRFLEGLFQHHLHCDEFITIVGGLERLGRITALPCLPYDFANSVSSDSMVQVIRTLAEATPNATLTFLSNLVKKSMTETKDFWEKSGGPSKLAPLLDFSPTGEDEVHQSFRRLVTLQTRVTLLSEVYATAGYAHGRTALAILQALMGRGAPEIIPDLGSLHRACVWENIVLKKYLPAQSLDVPASSSDAAAPETATRTHAPVATGGESPGLGATLIPSALPAPASRSKEEDSPLNTNAKALKHVLSQMPAALAPLFQAIVKLFNVNPKRLPDASHKKQILESAPVLADVMLQHLSFSDQDDELSSFAYLTVALGLVTVLLVDERTSQALHTVLLVSFERVGGIHALLSIARLFMKSIERIIAVAAEERTDTMHQELIHAYGGLKVFLHLLQPVVSSKLLFEAAQTALLLTPEKKDGEPDFFEPHKFLVQLRVTILPVVRDLWEATWLQSAPLGLIKLVVQIALEFVKAENEESSGELAAPIGPLAATMPPLAAIIQPDENRIRQITDMGFSRRSVERALVRTRNNVAAATELLISQPYLFPAELENEEPEARMDEDPTAEGVATITGTRAGSSDSPPDAIIPTDSSAPQADVPGEKKADEWLKELNALRDPLKADIGPRALRLVDEHPSLVFEVQPIFTGPRGSYQEHCVRRLVEDIKSFSPLAYDAHELPMAVRCRLLALALNTSASQDVLGADTKNVMDLLLALLLSKPQDSDADSAPVPKWLAAHLLVVEALLTMGEQPRAITLPKDGEPIQTEELGTGPPYSEARPLLLDLCMRLLSMQTLTQADFLSTLRMIVLLTRDHMMACEFVKRDGVPSLLRHLKLTPEESSVAVKSHIMIVIRHVVEDADTLRQTMRVEIKRYLTNPKHRFTDVNSYVRGCTAPALRDPAAFIQVTGAMCQLSRPYGSPQQVLLKPDVLKDTLPTNEQTTGEVDVIQADLPIDAGPTAHNTHTSESLERVVHLLINELSRRTKPIADIAANPLQQPEITPRPADASADVSSTAAAPPTCDVDKEHHHACFIMQTLTELLFSYDSCKAAFLAFTNKKRLQTPAKESGNKFRTAALHLLLNELITFGTLDPRKNKEAHDRIVLSNWAMSVIVALCVDSNFAQDVKDLTSDVVAVRRFVLEAVSRAIKDLPLGETMEARYGRLLALADLCHRLLTVRPYSVSKKQDEIPTHIAKVMLEKNFVGILTNALGEIDLNYPNVRHLVSAILRPLEHLTKIAIKTSRTSDKSKETVLTQAYDEDSDVSTDDEQGAPDEAREETPDLYRNSSLGMYTGEMEDVQFPADDDMDEDVEEEDGDVEMDYGDETGSEDTSNTEEGDDGIDLDAATHSVGTWQDEDEDNDEHSLVEHDVEVGGGDEDEDDDDDDDDDDDGDEGDDDDDDDEDDDEEELEGAGLLWQPADGDDETGDDPLGDAVSVEIPVGQGNGNDAEALSEDDGFVGGLQVIDAPDEEQQGEDDGFEMIARDPRGFGGFDTLEGASPRGIRRTIVNAEQDLGIFGRVRAPVPANADNDAVAHPLLVETGTPATQATTAQSRARRTQRNENATAVLHTIQDVLGPAAVQIYQRVINRNLDAIDPVRVDIVENPELGRAQLRFARTGRTGETRSEARGFDPMLTLQRWTEEVKILQGKVAVDRLSKLQNHVVLAMLPAAVKAAEEAKARETLRREQEEEAKAVEEAKVLEEARVAEEAAQKAKAETEATMTGDEPMAPAEPSTHSTARAEPETTDAGPSMSGTGTVNPQAQSSEDHAQVSLTGAVDGDTEMADEASPELVADAMPSAAEPGPSNVAERLTVIIHGSAVDITDTGIDPTFLEALPDDMREEVLNQHIRDQRAARVERPADSEISSEFLDALPPELRAEIIQQEGVERARRRAEEARTAATTAATTGQAPVPAEIDPASFIASLDPTLRQVVLLDQEEGFIQSLPAHMIAEAAGYRATRREPLPVRTGIPRTAPVRKPTVSRDSIQLLDKASIAVLVRLLFFPQALKKKLLFMVLVNLCENAKTRTDLFNLLFDILQDGSGDLTAIDKSFAQLSFRTPKSPANQTLKSMGKQRASSDYLSTPSLPQSEAAPELIAQRSLEAMSYIVNSNEMSSLFFLTEHEVPAGLRKGASKKGKGKERQMPQTHFPIVLLLGLLDRRTLLRTPSITESVVTLLATITRPLSSLLVKDAEKPNTSPISGAIAASSLSTSEGSGSVRIDAGQQADLSISQVDENAPVSDAHALLPDASAPSSDPPATSSDAPIAISTTSAQEPAKPNAPSTESPEEKMLLANPPQIPHAVLRLIVNILTMGECSGRTFQQTLALIQHLSYIPDTREIVAQELRSKAQELGQMIHADLEDLANVLQEALGDALSISPVSKFSPASSDQAKLLRVLKTIDYMYSSKAVPSRQTEDAERVQAIYESFRFAPLWARLGDCLAVIEEKSSVEHVATVLLPLIESLMVVCKYVGSATVGSARAILSSASPRSPTTSREAMEDLFVTFTDNHRKILNTMVRNNPSLMSGSFSLLVNNPRVLDFDNKRNYFNLQLHPRTHSREHHGTLQLNVRRQRVFEDSFQYLQRKTGEQIKHGKLSIRFYDEEGVDAGGLTREWFQILARQMFDPNYALFQPCVADKLTYQPNRASWVNPEHLSFFKFVGRVIGKAIYDGRLLDAYFARSFYRQLLGKPVDYRDVEWVDPEYYNSLCWILENDPSILDLTFSVEADEFGVTKIVPLKEDGATISVTNESKKEFVQLSAQYRLYSSIKDQIDALLVGFYDVIPKDLIAIFNEQEVELLISGTPDVDVDEWRAATEYHGYSGSDPVIVWWWRALKSFNREERAKVLSFATGTSRVPLGGFGELQGVQGVQKFSIHRAYGASDRLPQAHTCFNQIDLPEFSSYEKLRQQLLFAINEGGEGFGFA